MGIFKDDDENDGGGSMGTPEGKMKMDPPSDAEDSMVVSGGGVASNQDDTNPGSTSNELGG